VVSSPAFQRRIKAPGGDSLVAQEQR
jgi:hypothetical protein